MGRWSRSVVAVAAGKGDFEDGYVRGFRDSSKLTGKSAKDQMEGMDDRFQAGYVHGLRDAGFQGLSTSMHDLSRRHTTGLPFPFPSLVPPPLPR